MLEVGRLVGIVFGDRRAEQLFQGYLETCRQRRRRLCNLAQYGSHRVAEILEPLNMRLEIRANGSVSQDQRRGQSRRDFAGFSRRPPGETGGCRGILDLPSQPAKVVTTRLALEKSLAAAVIGISTQEAKCLRLRGAGGAFLWFDGPSWKLEGHF